MANTAPTLAGRAAGPLCYPLVVLSKRALAFSRNPPMAPLRLVKLTLSGLHAILLVRN